MCSAVTHCGQSIRLFLGANTSQENFDITIHMDKKWEVPRKRFIWVTANCDWNVCLQSKASSHSQIREFIERDIAEPGGFFLNMYYWTVKVSFRSYIIDFRDEQTWPSPTQLVPAMKLLDGFIFRRFEIYRHKKFNFYCSIEKVKKRLSNRHELPDNKNKLQ